MTCPKCETRLSPDARFCHKCGAKIAQEETTGWRAGLPWAIAGLSVGALLAIVIGRLGGNDGGASTPAAAGPGGTVRASDISQMSPEERANRLFDRVMRHAEAGQMDSVQFFLPMAVQTHMMLPALSTDARFHIGLLHLVGGSGDAAMAQADTILRATPNHLFGLMLRARALEARGDSAAARRAFSAFLSNVAAERARQRPEYADHATTLDLFRDEARTKAAR